MVKQMWGHLSSMLKPIGSNVGQTDSLRMKDNQPLFVFSHFLVLLNIGVQNHQHYPWRGGRVVEGAALEMLFRGDSNEGSNPSLSVY